MKILTKDKDGKLVSIMKDVSKDQVTYIDTDDNDTLKYYDILEINDAHYEVTEVIDDELIMVSKIDEENILEVRGIK